MTYRIKTKKIPLAISLNGQKCIVNISTLLPVTQKRGATEDQVSNNADVLSFYKSFGIEALSNAFTKSMYSINVSFLSSIFNVQS